jgi:hypothetical protein
MQPAPAYFTASRSHQPRLQPQTYSFPNLSSEPAPQFEYPIVIASEEELDQFLGDVISGVGKAVGSVTKAIDKVVPISKIAKGVGDVVSAVDKVVPVSLLVPGGVLMRFAGDTVSRVARGENVLQAVGRAAGGVVGDVRKGLQLASMVAPFIPGIGTGVAAALGAASALANGEPITDAIIAAARTAIPGGAIAQTAFDMASNLAKGQNIGEAMLNTVRSKIPDNPIARAAFDTGLALVKGQSLQQAVLSSAGKLLPKSPFAETALSFVNKAMSGQNIQTAALSHVGNLAYQKLQRTGTLNAPGLAAALKPAPAPLHIPFTRGRLGSGIGGFKPPQAGRTIRIPTAVLKAPFGQPVAPAPAGTKGVGPAAPPVPPTVVRPSPPPATSQQGPPTTLHVSPGYQYAPDSSSFLQSPAWPGNIPAAQPWPQPYYDVERDAPGEQLPQSGRWVRKHGHVVVLGAST